MDYTESVRKAISFIHREYGEDITVSDVSKHVYLSPSYFSTVFRTLTGYTMKEYILRYRLFQIALELKNTKKPIVVIAYEQGFSSQQALTKSFTQIFGISPAKFRRSNMKAEPFPPKNMLMEGSISMDIKKSFNNVKFETKNCFYAIGIETDINYNRVGKGTDYIADLYERWNGEKLLEQIPDQVNKNVIYGITHEETEDDTAKYMICAEVSTLENLPSGFIGRKFNACDYAVFETTLDVIWKGEFWKYFFRTWTKEQGFEVPEIVYSKRDNILTRSAAFEVYDENWTDSSSIIKIYAPILRK